MKKTTTQDLTKRLTQYSSLSMAIAGIAHINAQVGYTDPPDILVQKDGLYSVEIDLDDNGTFDLKFYQQSAGARVLANSSNSAQILGSIMPPDTFPYALNSSDPISSGQMNWRSGTLQILNNSSGAEGHWANQTEKFLGIRFKIDLGMGMGPENHYGWVRLSVPTNADEGFTIHDYYYNPTPNQPIQAGQFASLSVYDDTFLKVKIVASQKRISLYNLNESADFKLFSLSGQSVLEGKTSQNTYVIEANTVASGIYVLQLIDVNSKAVLKKKVVL